MDSNEIFRYELTHSEDADKWKTTTVTCHGRLTSQNSHEIETVVRPLIQDGGKILIDLTDLLYLDSSGLGTLVTLKISAINKGYCTLELINLSPKVKQLLSMTNLTELFSRK
jgi:anti-sigma B factor antagonist